jgi:thioredoxin reductase/ferredoxin
MTIPLITRYTHWLHTRWPAGKVETLPVVKENGSTNVPGLWVVGDLAGVPLLKFSADMGAKVVGRIVDPGGAGRTTQSSADAPLDLVIIGAGVAGVSAAIEARKHGLRYKLLESAERFSTIVNFPKAKPIYTYPAGMKPAGALHFREQVHPKETLLADLNEQAEGIEIQQATVTHVTRTGGVLNVMLADGQSPIQAQSVIIAIGRSGNYRMLNVEGENLDKVSNRLHDPRDFAGQQTLVVGGGDSALESAIALADAGATVTLSYRRPEFARPKPDNIERLTELQAAGKIRVEMASEVRKIGLDSVTIMDKTGKSHDLPNDAVFTMIGREAPLDFFRKSNVRIHGERTWAWWITLIAFLAFSVWIYHWKKGGVVVTGLESIDYYLDIGKRWSDDLKWFPYSFADWLGTLGGAWANPANLLGTLTISLGQPGFYYTLAYCACVVGFGIDRVRRKPTPYIKKQTTVLALIQCVPLFVLPYIFLPWIGHLGAFDAGAGKWFADEFFPVANYGHGREYWRAFGFVLAWPLFIWNVFTEQPMWGWLIVSLMQTFVLIPIAIYYFGKGVYCGWICSCGALAETLGDRHRTKMPHGPFWNRFNMVGQVFLAFAMVLLGLRILAWSGFEWAKSAFEWGLKDLPIVNYVWFVDLLWAGIIGVGVYFWFSGRFWCRFACPLAALMHIYARFSKFAIVSDKKKCISCNVCTSVCHQGIDVMSFANKGQPMQDPQCVRCSACVVNCPTGVLTFGMVHSDGSTQRKDKTLASFVHIAELRVNGKKLTDAR